jgi:hypothetical protein
VDKEAALEVAGNALKAKAVEQGVQFSDIVKLTKGTAHHNFVRITRHSQNVSTSPLYLLKLHCHLLNYCESGRYRYVAIRNRKRFSVKPDWPCQRLQPSARLAAIALDTDRLDLVR